MRSWLQAHRWRLLMLVSALLMLAVAVQGLFTVYRLESRNRQLVEQSLPLFEAVQAVRNRLNEQEMLFYQYYLEGKSPFFIDTMAETHAQNLLDMNRIAAVTGPMPALTELETAIRHLQQISVRFDKAMLAPTNWDDARAELAEFTPVAEQVSRDSLALLGMINDGIKRNSAASLDETGHSLLWMGFMSLMLFIAAIVLQLINERLALAVRVQKRLASFPDYNTNPVLALDRQGKILYANTGAQTLAQALFPGSGPETILPADAESLIRRAQHSHGNVERDYYVADRAYRAELHWLQELNESHVYLADVTAQKQAHEQLVYLAYHHSLTGLPNRQQLERTFSHGQFACLVMLEIDRYQEIITSSGHAVAEQLIKQSAKRFRAVTHELIPDLFHIESNVFALLAREDTDVAAVIETLRVMMHAPIEIGQRHFYVSISAGSVSITLEDELYEAMRKADSALRIVTGRGGDGFRHFDKVLDAENLHRTALQNDLRHAIAKDELQIRLQPIHAAASGTFVAAEALLRWHRRHDE